MTFLAAAALAGCTTKYSEEDVRGYIENDLGIKDYELTEGPVKIEDPEGYEDEWWTVKTHVADIDADVTFHVINDYSYSAEWVTNRLTDDYRAKLFDWMTVNYDFSGRLVPNVQEYSGIPADGYFTYEIEGKDDFYASVPEIAALSAFLSEYPSFAGSGYAVTYTVKPRTVADKYLAERGYRVPFSVGDIEEDIIIEMNRVGAKKYDHGAVYRYLSDCMQYGLMDRVSEFSDSEILPLVDNTDLKEVMTADGRVIKRGVVYYNDLDNIAIGSMYELLTVMGFRVTGDWQHYSFTGADGEEYELGYDIGGGDAKASISVEDASKMIGIDLDNGYPDVEAVIPKKLLDSYGVTAESFTQEIEDLGNEYFREISTGEDGSVHIIGKQREFSRLIHHYEDRVNADVEELRLKDEYFWAYPDHMSVSYSGVRFRFSAGSAIDFAADGGKLNEIVFLTAVNQILDNDITNGSVSMKLRFAIYDGGETKDSMELDVSDCSLPDYSEVSRLVRGE